MQYVLLCLRHQKEIPYIPNGTKGYAAAAAAAVFIVEIQSTVRYI